MRKVTIVYEVFTFDELDKEAQELAINEEIQFLMDTSKYEDLGENFKKAVDKAEEMKTPWFTMSYVYDYCKEEVLHSIKMNGYEFTKDGKTFIE